MARGLGDRRRLSQILYSQALTAMVGTGDLEAALVAGTEGRGPAARAAAISSAWRLVRTPGRTYGS